MPAPSERCPPWRGLGFLLPTQQRPCAAAAAVTWLLRVLPITVVPVTRLPAAVQRSLPHVGPAVLAALVAATVFGAPAGATPGFLGGALASGLVAWWTRGVVLPTVAGLATVATLGAVW